MGPDTEYFEVRPVLRNLNSMKFKISSDAASFLVDCITKVLIIGTEYDPDDEGYENNEELMKLINIIRRGGNSQKTIYDFEIPSLLSSSFYQCLSYGIQFYGLHASKKARTDMLQEIAGFIKDSDMVNTIEEELNLNTQGD